MLDYFHIVPPARPTLLCRWCVALNIGLLISADSLDNLCCRPARAAMTGKPLTHRTPSPSYTVRSPSHTMYTRFCTVDTSLLKIHNLSSKCTQDAQHVQGPTKIILCPSNVYSQTYQNTFLVNTPHTFLFGTPPPGGYIFFVKFLTYQRDTMHYEL